MPASYHPWGFDFHAEYHDFLEGPYARVPKELGCALAASFMVSPLVSIIDKAIVQDVSSAQKMATSMAQALKEMVTKPKSFVGGLSFRLTFAVYFGTYAVANLSEAAMDYQKVKKEENRKLYKVTAAATANVGLLAWRDSIFARAFGQSATSAKTPLRTIALFAFRDTCTMAATFWGAPKVCNHILDEYHWDEGKTEILCAFTIPVISQVLTAPAHIHAIDYYNRPAVALGSSSRMITVSDRLACIRQEFSKVSFMRGIRILPAFGIGSYSNNKFREWFIRQEDEELLLSRQLTNQMTVLRNNTVQMYRQMTMASSPKSNHKKDDSNEK